VRLIPLAVLLCVVSGCSRNTDRVTAITGATLMDGSSRPPVTPATIVIRGRVIEAMGPAAEVPVPAGAVRFDAREKYVFPADAAAPLAPGGEADLIITRVNPATDPDYAKKTTGRMQGGVWIQYPE